MCVGVHVGMFMFVKRRQITTDSQYLSVFPSDKQKMEKQPCSFKYTQIRVEDCDFLVNVLCCRAKSLMRSVIPFAYLPGDD